MSTIGKDSAAAKAKDTRIQSLLDHGDNSDSDDEGNLSSRYLLLYCAHVYGQIMNQKISRAIRISFVCAFSPRDGEN